ncbi:MAG: ATPase, partial [Actinobacteria bacterium]|nr:ATPase [Actinomycetota bacterium]MCG2808114.1 ATPase [Coriobacteriia bacterium]
MSDATYLGTVQDVNGATVSVALDPDTVSGLAFIDGHGYRIGQIGSFVRIPIGFTDLFGIVSQVGAGAVPESRIEDEPHGYRWMRVQLIGEGQRLGAFERGISQYPTIGDEAHLVTDS